MGAALRHQHVCATVCLACLLWLVAGPAAAALHVVAQKVVTPAMTMAGVDLTLRPVTNGQLQLDVKIRSLDLPAAGWKNVQVDLSGRLQRPGDRSWQFAGALDVHGAPGGALANSAVQVRVDPVADNLGIDISQASAQIDAALPLDQLTHAQVSLQQVPLQWLEGLLLHAWSGKLTSGTVNATAALDVGSRGLRTSADFSIQGAGFDSAHGKLAAAKLGMSGHAGFDNTGAHPSLVADVAMHGGALLLGPIYAVLPSHSVHLAVDTQFRTHGVVIEHLRFTDPGALHLAGSAVIGPKGTVPNLHLTSVRATFPAAYQRYGKTWLTTLGYKDLTTSGQFEGALWWDAHGLRSVDLTAHDLHLSDAKAAVAGLDGELDWQRHGKQPVTTMTWDTLRLDAITLGAQTSQWQSIEGKLALQSPLQIPVMGGTLGISALVVDPRANAKQSVQIALTVTKVDMARLSAAFGWPHFTGTLSGSMPGLHFVGQQIGLEGGLTMKVFGGSVKLTQVSLQHPFGTAPVFAGSVQIKSLNLADMTDVFDFGHITGNLSGSINDLRMVGWRPVAFKAQLATDDDGGRISKRAVNNLAAVGGSGGAPVLQGAIIRLFSSFGYRHLGLSCTLQGSVCHMGGLKKADDGGYLIVEGRGLPHLTVVGHQREVSWPVLIARIKAAIASGGPRIRK